MAYIYAARFVPSDAADAPRRLRVRIQSAHVGQTACSEPVARSCVTLVDASGGGLRPNFDSDTGVSVLSLTY